MREDDYRSDSDVLRQVHKELENQTGLVAEQYNQRVEIRQSIDQLNETAMRLSYLAYSSEERNKRIYSALKFACIVLVVIAAIAFFILWKLVRG